MVQIQTGYFPDDLKMYTMRIVEGGSLGNFWGPKFVGFNDNGGAIYEDLDGVEGITEADYQVIGNAYPDVLLSLQNTFSYKQWSLSFLLRSSIGNDVLNQSRVYYEGFGYFGTRNILRRILFVAVRGGRFLSQTRQHHAELRFQAQIEGHLQAALLCHGTEPLYHNRLQGHRPRSQHLGLATRHRLV